MTFRRFALLALVALALLQGSCQSRQGRLYDRIDGLRLAGIKVYSGDELNQSEQETLLAEFRTPDVSFSRIQERREALRELHRRKAVRVRPRRVETPFDGDFFGPFQGYPPIDYKRRRSSSKK